MNTKIAPFNEIDLVTIYARDDPKICYRELLDKRNTTTGCAMRITVRYSDVAEDDGIYQLILRQVDGDLWVRGDFFNTEPEKEKRAHLIRSVPEGSLVFEVFDGDDPEPWIIRFDLTEMEAHMENTLPLSTRAEPLLAKKFKDSFGEYIKALLASRRARRALDGDRPAIYIKFLNGRTAQIICTEDLGDDKLAELFYIHDVEHVLLKKYWASVSAAILFSVAFRFFFPDNNGVMQELILCRCPDDEHAADDFCADILVGMQTELEHMLNDEIKTTIENGFDRIEALILENRTPQSTERRSSPLDRLKKPPRKPR